MIIIFHIFYLFTKCIFIKFCSTRLCLEQSKNNYVKQLSQLFLLDLFTSIHTYTPNSLTFNILLLFFRIKARLDFHFFFFSINARHSGRVHCDL